MFKVHYYDFAKKYSFTGAFIFRSKSATKESLATSSNGLT